MCKNIDMYEKLAAVRTNTHTHGHSRPGTHGASLGKISLAY